MILLNYETIYNETNGEVLDFHASERSVIIYSESIINSIKKNLI